MRGFEEGCRPGRSLAIDQHDLLAGTCSPDTKQVMRLVSLEDSSAGIQVNAVRIDDVDFELRHGQR